MVMYNLFYCCVSVWEREFYLTMNIADIFVCCFFVWNSWANKGYRTYHFNPEVEGFVDFAFLIMAIVALVVYFVKKSYWTLVHYIYMIFR